MDIGPIASDDTFYFTVTDKENSMLDFVRNDEGEDGKYKMNEYRYGEDRTFLSYTTYSLYYFNGKERLKIADGLYSDYLSGPYPYLAHSKSFVRYSIFDATSMDRLNISDVNDDSDISEWFYEQQKRCSETFLSVSGGDGVSLGKGAMVQGDTIDAKCNWMYYIFNADDDGNGILYKVKLNGSTPSKVDSDVGSVEIVTPKGGTAYIKNIDGGSGDLCLDGVKIDSNVQAGSVMSFRTEGYKNYYYLCDYNRDYESDEPCGGTLKVVKNGKGEKIADNVWSYYPMGGGKTAVITDFRMLNWSGELSVVKGDKKTSIDVGVERIVYAQEASPSGETPLFYGTGSYAEYGC